MTLDGKASSCAVRIICCGAESMLPFLLCAKFNSFISYAKIKIKDYPIRSRMR
jgi:hypothetical protein